MAELKATSTSKFKHSGKTSPHTKEIFKARTKKQIAIKTWAGKNNPECFFSPLAKGAVVSVCDAILSKAKNTWYYVKTSDGHYGFICAGDMQSVSNKALKFIGHLNEIHDYVKDHGNMFIYEFDSALNSFTKAKARVKAGKKAGMTCLVPMAWALQAMGIKRSDGKVWVSGNDGSFKDHYTGGVKKNLTRIKSDGPIGKTVKAAVDANLLKPGDFIAFKDKTHTAAYTGDGYLVYDGGHNSMKDGKHTGIKANYENYKHKISEILRWKE